MGSISVSHPETVGSLLPCRVLGGTRLVGSRTGQLEIYDRKGSPNSVGDEPGLDTIIDHTLSMLHCPGTLYRHKSYVVSGLYRDITS